MQIWKTGPAEAEGREVGRFGFGSGFELFYATTAFGVYGRKSANFPPSRLS